MSIKIKQRDQLKFPVKLVKGRTKHLRILKDVEESLSRPRVLQWHIRFPENFVEVENNEVARWPTHRQPIKISRKSMKKTGIKAMLGITAVILRIPKDTVR